MTYSRLLHLLQYQNSASFCSGGFSVSNYLSESLTRTILSWRIPPAKPTGPPATIPTYNKEREDIFEACGCPIFVVLSRIFSSTRKCFRRPSRFLASFSLLNRPSKINLCYSPPPVNSSWNSACFNILKKTVTKFWHVRAKIRCKENIWRQCIHHWGKSR